MATLGATAEPTNSAEAWTGSNYSMHGHVLQFPAGGPWRIQTVSSWCAGYGINSPARHVVWNGSSGAVNAYSAADFTLVARAFSNTGSDLYTSNVYANGPGLTPLDVGGNTVVIAGFQRQEASYGAFFGLLASGSHRDKIAAGYLDDMASNTTHSVGAMGVYITYIQANSAPSAPTLLSPNGGVIIGTDLTPLLAFRVSDPDGDNLSAYEIEVSTVSNFATTVWDSGKVSLGLSPWTSGSDQVIEVGTTLVRGTLYYWRVRVWDDNDVVGAWSA